MSNPALYPPLCHVDEEVVELFQSSGGNLTEQLGELVLPFLAVTEYGKFEWRAVQQDKLYVQHCLLGGYVISNLCISEQAQ